MCRRVDCKQCGKPTYAGCGAHVEQVLANVPPENRCRCREVNAKAPATQGTRERRSWLGELFRK
jgi:hypothetical protein